MRRIELAGLLPTLLLLGALVAGAQVSPANDSGSTVQMTVTPVR